MLTFADAKDGCLVTVEQDVPDAGPAYDRYRGEAGSGWEASLADLKRYLEGPRRRRDLDRGGTAGELSRESQRVRNADRDDLQRSAAARAGSSSRRTGASRRGPAPAARAALARARLESAGIPERYRDCTLENFSDNGP